MRFVSLGASDCTGLVDLSLLTRDGLYMIIIPADPSAATENGTGYHVVNENGGITVCAPHAESGNIIEAKRS